MPLRSPRLSRSNLLAPIFCAVKLATAPVSYTHLDVYKRQILTFAATPAGRKLYLRLPEKVQSVLTPVLVLLSLVLCTASLVDASYNPFLYFRF